MAVAKKNPVKDTTPLVKPDAVAAVAQAPARTAAKKLATGDPANAVAARTLVPAAPETKASRDVKHKRLSKVFSRPLDKKIRKDALVRDRFTLPVAEYAQLVLLKKRLGEQGVASKKSELMRAGLMLILELGEPELKSLLARLPVVG